MVGMPADLRDIKVAGKPHETCINTNVFPAIPTIEPHSLRLLLPPPLPPLTTRSLCPKLPGSSDKSLRCNHETGDSCLPVHVSFSPLCGRRQQTIFPAQASH